MRVVLVPVALVTVFATVLGACTATTQTQSGSGSDASSSPRITQPAESGIAALRRRPWVVPVLAPGAHCPVTLTKHRPDPEMGELWGSGPVGPVGLNGGVLQYHTAARSDGFTDVAWGEQKVMWGVDPAITTPVLVRGHQLDGPNAVRFEDPAVPELVLDPQEDALPGGWRTYPGSTRLRAYGCYAYQADAVGGTWTIVFRAERLY
jgi:hypothetical protein